jgi:hypothetical protein
MRDPRMVKIESQPAKQAMGEWARQTAASETSNSPVDAFEVIVTAEKRAERLQDVPVPLTVEWLLDCDGYDPRADRQSALLRWIGTRRSHYRALVLTLRLQIQHFSIAVRFCFSRFRISRFLHLLGKAGSRAAPVHARHRSQTRPRHRVARASTNAGFSQVQRLII